MQVHKVVLVSRGELGRLVHLVLEGLLELQAILAYLVQQVFVDQMVLLAVRVLREMPEVQVQWECPDLLLIRGLRGTQGRQGLMVIQDFQVLKDLLV